MRPEEFLFETVVLTERQVGFRSITELLSFLKEIGIDSSEYDNVMIEPSVSLNSGGLISSIIVKQRIKVKNPEFDKWLACLRKQTAKKIQEMKRKKPEFQAGILAKNEYKAKARQNRLQKI